MVSIFASVFPTNFPTRTHASCESKAVSNPSPRGSGSGSKMSKADIRGSADCIVLRLWAINCRGCFHRLTPVASCNDEAIPRHCGRRPGHDQATQCYRYAFRKDGGKCRRHSRVRVVPKTNFMHCHGLEVQKRLPTHGRLIIDVGF